MHRSDAGLAEQEPPVAVDQHDRDDRQQHADQDRAERVADGVAGQLVQEQAEEGDHQADERGGVLGEDRTQRRVRGAEHVLEGARCRARDAFACACRYDWRNEMPSKTNATASTM